MILNNKIKIESDIIKQIGANIEGYRKYFEDVAKSPIGKYSINNILETVDESLNYLEIFTPILYMWVEDFLGANRGKLWLYYGLEKGSYLTDYCQQSKTDFNELKTTWPFLFASSHTYKEFTIDFALAQSEILRQRKRQSTQNPNYKPFHPDGCSRGCCCWMLDDMEQWLQEEREEIEASNNIFFNTKLQSDFYDLILKDNKLEELKEQWGLWKPERSTININNDIITSKQGQTPIGVIIDWIKKDFNYCRFLSMFNRYDTFINIWNNIDYIDPFIKCQREKLKTIMSILE
jgi:hypothetical protein